MDRRIKGFILLMALSLVFLTACQSEAEADAPAQAVVNYIQALVAKDAAQLSETVCKAWEESALVELDGFTGVNIQTQDLSCATSGTDGADQLVDCTGKIVASYNGENQEFSVDRQTYRVTQEDGQWRMCGYK